ncbi:unnamed protein product [Protopolystoma xenopodis]|uniref:Uncharacterized protein n=1 Tax=Protopolystoma xenopodis TaxID=117903 RepID=A0A448WRH3_9PLAT|nr:unnamed protein product [Protopolystoma xenopodis]
MYLRLSAGSNEPSLLARPNPCTLVHLHNPVTRLDQVAPCHLASSGGLNKPTAQGSSDHLPYIYAIDDASVHLDARVAAKHGCHSPFMRNGMQNSSSSMLKETSQSHGDGEITYSCAS